MGNYADMVTRTTSRQASNIAALFKNPDHDLYQINEHGTTCPLCAPFEGRVYSRSGTSEIYPPLSDAFGKIDPTGSNDLSNTYLNIHPNCLHVLKIFREEWYDQEELDKFREFSNPETNPYNVDPRTKAQQEAYRKKEQARTKALNDYKQFERYTAVLGEGFPKTPQTFIKHKRVNSEKYQGWMNEYRRRNAEIKKITG